LNASATWRISVIEVSTRTSSDRSPVSAIFLACFTALSRGLTRLRAKKNMMMIAIARMTADPTSTAFRICVTPSRDSAVVDAMLTM
jgi:hypothetical protein